MFRHIIHAISYAVVPETVFVKYYYIKSDSVLVNPFSSMITLYSSSKFSRSEFTAKLFLV